MIKARIGPRPLNNRLVFGKNCLRVGRYRHHAAWREIRGEITGIMDRCTPWHLHDREVRQLAGGIHRTGVGS